MSATLRETLVNLTREKAPGPSASYSIPHLLLFLELVASKSAGRSKLAEELEVGEGVMRTIIGRLKDDELIETSKKGCSLTEKGLRLWKEYRSIAQKTEIEKNELTFADYSFAILIRDSADKVRSGMEQRDAAVMTGAKGATTLLFKNGHLMLPSTSRNVAKDFPTAINQIGRLLKPKENDVIIIVSSDDRKRAEFGVLAAVWTLLNDR